MDSSAYETLKSQYRLVCYPCEACGSMDMAAFQNHGRIAEAGVYGAVPITICNACGFKMQNPRYEDGFYADYYEAMYREVAFGALAPSATYIDQQKSRGAGVLAFAREQGIEPGRMLDHGCASGATMLAWREAGWVVRGIDPHRPSVESGRALGLDIEIGVGEALPFEDESFDLILSLGSTEHAYDLGRTMCEAWRVLKPGGHLMIRWRSNKIFGSPLEYYNHNHYRFFSPNTWRLCLERYGFAVAASTDRKLEGWDSYGYILARREAALDGGAVQRLLAANVKDDARSELAEINRLRRAYNDRCKRFLAFAQAHADEPASRLVEKLRGGEAGFPWGFLGGDPAAAIERSRMEALRYTAEYESGRVR